MAAEAGNLTQARLMADRAAVGPEPLDENIDSMAVGGQGPDTGNDNATGHGYLWIRGLTPQPGILPQVTKAAMAAPSTPGAMTA